MGYLIQTNRGLPHQNRTTTMQNITSITITATECAPEINDMVCRTFKTATGWAGAFAAIARDAADYPPGAACNKVFATVVHGGGTTSIKLEVRAGDVAPFDMDAWLWVGA